MRHFWNVLFLMLGLSTAFIGSWQLDLVCAPLVNLADQIFYIRVGFRGGRLILQWDATPLKWQDAYVIFFLVLWVGFIISLFALWFWKDDLRESRRIDL